MKEYELHSRGCTEGADGTWKRGTTRRDRHAFALARRGVLGGAMVVPMNRRRRVHNVDGRCLTGRYEVG